MDRNQLIEDAAKAIWMTRNGADSSWAEMAWAEMTMPDDWSQEALDALEEARAALDVFEGAYTPTDDEREALLQAMHGAVYPTLRIIDLTEFEQEDLGLRADAVLSAGFHRTVQGEPSDAQLIAAMNAYDPRFPGEDLDDFQENEIADMRAALHAAAKAGGGN